MGFTFLPCLDIVVDPWSSCSNLQIDFEPRLITTFAGIVPSFRGSSRLKLFVLQEITILIIANRARWTWSLHQGACWWFHHRFHPGVVVPGPLLHDPPASPHGDHGLQLGGRGDGSTARIRPHEWWIILKYILNNPSRSVISAMYDDGMVPEKLTPSRSEKKVGGWSSAIQCHPVPSSWMPGTGHFEGAASDALQGDEAIIALWHWRWLVYIYYIYNYIYIYIISIYLWGVKCDPTKCPDMHTGDYDMHRHKAVLGLINRGSGDIGVICGHPGLHPGHPTFQGFGLEKSHSPDPT